jgi:hypothetical protein
MVLEERKMRVVASSHTTKFGEKLRKLKTAGIEAVVSSNEHGTVSYINVPADKYAQAITLLASVKSRTPKRNKGWN